MTKKPTPIEKNQKVPPRTRKVPAREQASSQSASDVQVHSHSKSKNKTKTTKNDNNSNHCSMAPSFSHYQQQQQMDFTPLPECEGQFQIGQCPNVEMSMSQMMMIMLQYQSFRSFVHYQDQDEDDFDEEEAVEEEEGENDTSKQVYHQEKQPVLELRKEEALGHVNRVDSAPFIAQGSTGQKRANSQQQDQNETIVAAEQTTFKGSPSSSRKRKNELNVSGSSSSSSGDSISSNSDTPSRASKRAKTMKDLTAIRIDKMDSSDLVATRVSASPSPQQQDISSWFSSNDLFTPVLPQSSHFESQATEESGSSNTMETSCNAFNIMTPTPLRSLGIDDFLLISPLPTLDLVNDNKLTTTSTKQQPPKSTTSTTSATESEEAPNRALVQLQTMLNQQQRAFSHYLEQTKHK